MCSGLFNALLVLEQSEILHHNRQPPYLAAAAIFDQFQGPVPHSATRQLLHVWGMFGSTSGESQIPGSFLILQITDQYQ